MIINASRGTKIILLASVPVVITAVLISGKALSNIKENIINYLEGRSNKEDPAYSSNSEKSAGYSYQGFSYSKGDWEKYILRSKYKLAGPDFFNEDYYISRDDAGSLNTYGSLRWTMAYGKSKFTKDKYRTYDGDKPASRVVEDGFNANHDLKLHMEGTVGKRLSIYIDHDDEKKDNHYLMKYKALRDDEIIREINAGELDISLKNSKYVIYDENLSKGMGIDLTVKKGTSR